jgi:1-phosphatidylinositol-3-phosphate 5-kinase
MFQYPLCVDEHAKALITYAVWNDSLFLSSLYVMDYSLIVGIDEENQELVVGIVDYIRQFTWDKQIEKWVKSQQGSELPTVIAPKDYKARFRTAMWNYFVLVPGQFTQITAPSQSANAVVPSWDKVLHKYEASRAQSAHRRTRN